MAPFIRLYQLLFYSSSTQTHSHIYCNALESHTHTHTLDYHNNPTLHLSCSQTFKHCQRISAVAKHDYHSVLCLSYLPRCRLHRDQGILKTRTRGRENERETRGLRKERNKWNRGGGGWRRNRKRECLRRVQGTERRSKLKSEPGGSLVSQEKGGTPQKPG